MRTGPVVVTVGSTAPMYCSNAVWPSLGGEYCPEKVWTRYWSVVCG